MLSLLARSGRVSEPYSVLSSLQHGHAIKRLENATGSAGRCAPCPFAQAAVAVADRRFHAFMPLGPFACDAPALPVASFQGS